MRRDIDPGVLGGDYVLDRLDSYKIIQGTNIDLSAFEAHPHIGQELYAMGFTLRGGEDYNSILYSPGNIASAMYRIIDEDGLASKYGAAHGWARMTLPLLTTKSARDWNPMKTMYSGNIDLSGAFLRNASLKGLDLSMADLSVAELSHADLTETDLSNSVLTRAYMSGASFLSTVLFGADMREADLSEAKMHMVELSFADLSKAALKNAIIVWSRLDDARFLAADLGGAFMRHNTYYRALFSGAKLIGAEYDRAELLGEAYYDNTIEI